jgi:hypothetical protein
MNTVGPRHQPCLGKVFFLWALYGWAMLVLWRLLQGEPGANAIAWAVAAVVAAGLLLGMRAV